MLTPAKQLGVQDYVAHVTSIYAFLAEQSDLSPRNAKVNAALYRFVRDTMKPRTPEEVAAILGTPAIQQVAPSLWRLLSRAECEMEFYCASAMTGGETGAEERFSSYVDFIYRSNYEALVAAELDVMKWHSKPVPINSDSESLAFVGSGPLPISAIMFHLRTGLPVTCVDSDEIACVLGQQLVRYLAANESGCRELDNAIRFCHARGEEHDYATHPVVFIANLVAAKEPVVMRIMETSRIEATAVIRSAEGLSTLLYKPADGLAGEEGYDAYLTGKTIPSPEAINTSLIYRLPCAGGAKLSVTDSSTAVFQAHPGGFA
jgi:Nicotianamine synthase protein